MVEVRNPAALIKKNAYFAKMLDEHYDESGLVVINTKPKHKTENKGALKSIKLTEFAALSISLMQRRIK